MKNCKNLFIIFATTLLCLFLFGCGNISAPQDSIEYTIIDPYRQKNKDKPRELLFTWKEIEIVESDGIKLEESFTLEIYQNDDFTIAQEYYLFGTDDKIYSVILLEGYYVGDLSQNGWFDLIITHKCDSTMNVMLTVFPKEQVSARIDNNTIYSNPFSFTKVE